MRFTILLLAISALGWFQALNRVTTLARHLRPSHRFHGRGRSLAGRYRRGHGAASHQPSRRRNAAGLFARRYNEWEYTRRLEVEQASAGKLGYVHLRAMGPNDINQ